MLDRFALVDCGEVLTNDGDIVNGACILISEGKITDVVSDSPPSDFTHVSVGGRTVTPGLIDAHTHAVFAGSRANEYEMRAKGMSYQEIANTGGGIKASMGAVRKATEDELFEQSKRHIDWMIRSGTTTAEMKSGYGLTLDDELKMLRVIKRLGEETPIDIQATFLGAHAAPPEFDSCGDYMHHVCEDMLSAVKEQGIAVAVDAFVETEYFSHDDAEKLAYAAKAHNLNIRLHVDQFSVGGAELAAKLGATTADHLEQTTDSGIEALKASRTTPVLLPGSVYALGLDKYPDARKMIDRDLPVVLATDFNPGSSPTPSLPMVMSIACTQMGMTPHEAMKACTINAAQALGYTDRGQVKEGMIADLVVWDVDDYREIPYYFGVSHVHAVYKDGVELQR